MKKYSIIFSFMLAGLFLGSCANEGSSDEQSESTVNSAQEDMPSTANQSVEYYVDIEKSIVKWKGTMLGIKHHTGTLQFAKGIIKLNGDVINSGEVVVDMNTMKATDENYNPEDGQTKEKLIGHLKSEDFFHVEEYPHARFSIGDINGNVLEGVMNIRGVEQSIEVEVSDMHMHDNSIHVAAKTVIDRQKYNVVWKAMGDVVLSDEIELEIDITANQR